MTHLIHCIKRNELTSDHPLKHLFEVPNPPEQLFIQGSLKALKTLEQLPERGLAIVGTRAPQPRSIEFVQKIIRQLAGANLIILSGFARGIDAAAHWAALRSGLPTVAILGTGLNVNYPRENEELKAQILKADGILASEFPIGTANRGFQFLQRNRLIASWSLATWVIEASHRSGALNTARWARDQNRTCYAVPSYPGDPALAGNQILLDRDHALAFWDVHSLGSTWLELSTLYARKIVSKNSHKPQLADNKLVQQVQILTYRQGGATLQELFDWAISIGWSSEKFFEELQAAAQQNLIIDHKEAWISL